MGTERREDALQALGRNDTDYKYAHPDCDILETFLNPDACHRMMNVTFNCNEFTSLCPKTGQPDYGTIQIQYTPDNSCIESKSLKLYIFAFRNYQGFAEDIVRKIRDDILSACRPVWARVEGKFNVRGGIGIVAEAKWGEGSNANTGFGSLHGVDEADED